LIDVTSELPLSYVSPWVYPLISSSNRVLQRIFFGPLTVQGQEFLPLDGPAVLAIKHYSRWDPMVIAQLQTKAIRFMTNVNQFSGVQGWFLQRLGAFPIDLARPQKSSIKHMIELLHQDEIVGIFPEGGIVRDQPLRSLKPGTARLILQAESSAPQPGAIPITPIAIRYVPEAQRGASVYVDISPAFSSQDFEATSDKDRAAQMTQHLETVLRDRLQALQDLAPMPIP
jgi:1-acyl-sn-glycerol-3-phosphate acyltransferase